jgi:hypothetical protein
VSAGRLAAPVADTSPAAPGHRAARLQQALERLTDDLFTLEVNTIIKDSIMGTVIPDAGQALIDIVQDYELQLHEFGAAKEPPSGNSTVADLNTFEELRNRASEMYDGKPQAVAVPRVLRKSERLMLCRIRDNCDEIKGILEAVKARSPGSELKFTRKQAPNIDLLPAELMSIRKIWDIGTEEIVMQTVIQLGGDVTTRLSSAYATARDQPIVRIHEGSVTTSISTWNKLVETVGAFLASAARLALGR